MERPREPELVCLVEDASKAVEVGPVWFRATGQGHGAGVSASCLELAGSTGSGIRQAVESEARECCVYGNSRELGSGDSPKEAEGLPSW